MTREDFCNLLADTKAKIGLTTTDISFDMRMQLSTLNRLEKGKTNFSVQKIIEYVKCLKANLCLYKKNKSTKIYEYDDVISFIKKARKGIYSQRDLAKEIGCTHSTIANIESNISIVSIDVFLKILEVLGYELKIESI